jgi:serine/threonine protein kinase
MALEYVEGLSLMTVIRRGRERDIKMRSADAVFVCIQMLKALSYAHTRTDASGKPMGIVHRDISPHNVLIDDTGSVKVIDFGIARATENLVQTEADAIKGKIPYMSPEQAQGQQIDARSDLFAVGVTLYESLTYSPMHASPNTLETLKNVQQGVVPPIVEKLGGKVPDSLLAVLSRALKREPTDRHPDAAEMEKALALVLHELEPGYTSQRLARIVRELDVGRDSRKSLMREHSSAPVLPASLELSTPATSTPESATSPGIPSMIAPTPADAPVVLHTPSPTVAPPVGVGFAAALVGVAAALLLGAFVLMVIGSGGNDPPVSHERPAPAVIAASPTPSTTPPAPMQTPTPTPSPVPSPPAPPPPGPRPAPTSRPTPPPAPAPSAPTAVKASGCVVVAARPWAYVVVGGKRVGTTPLKCLELQAGPHELTLENPALGSEKKVRVEVTPGATVRVSEQM